jgi:hypothetical protein
MQGDARSLHSRISFEAFETLASFSLPCKKTIKPKNASTSSKPDVLIRLTHCMQRFSMGEKSLLDSIPGHIWICMHRPES